MIRNKLPERQNQGMIVSSEVAVYSRNDQVSAVAHESDKGHGYQSSLLLAHFFSSPSCLLSVGEWVLWRWKVAPPPVNGTRTTFEGCGDVVVEAESQGG